MAIDPIDLLCKDIDIPFDFETDPLTIIFPGVVLDLSLPVMDLPTPIDVSKQIIVSANAALAPLMPVFAVIDVVLLLFELAEALPDAITQLSITKIKQILVKLQAKIGRLKAIIPPLSVPAMVKSLLRVVLVFLVGLRDELAALVVFEGQINAADDEVNGLAADFPGASKQLSLSVGCARATLAAHFKGLGAGLGPLGRTLALVNLLLDLAGLPKIPTEVSIGGTAGLSIAPLDKTITILQAAHDAIPV